MELKCSWINVCTVFEMRGLYFWTSVRSRFGFRSKNRVFISVWIRFCGNPQLGSILQNSSDNVLDDPSLILVRKPPVSWKLIIRMTPFTNIEYIVTVQFQFSAMGDRLLTLTFWRRFGSAFREPVLNWLLDSRKFQHLFCDPGWYSGLSTYTVVHPPRIIFHCVMFRRLNGIYHMTSDGSVVIHPQRTSYNQLSQITLILVTVSTTLVKFVLLVAVKNRL